MMNERGADESLAVNGYAVVADLVPRELLSGARRFICNYLGADLAQPESWYAHSPLVWSVVPVHHAQEFWDIRQAAPVHECFADLLGTERLWVTMDRAIFKVPSSEAHPDHVDDSVMHWDVDPRETAPAPYQGMLFLTDAGPGQGCFECVPSIFQQLDRYFASHPGPLLDAPLDLVGHDIVEVPARAGDLVIWDARLPHQGGRNRGTSPRLSLPITMVPEGSDVDRQVRIECWREKRAPSWWRGWKGQIDPEPGAPAELTALGRRLAGLDRW